jgi:putative methyltransferase (TIGR04325 family)
VSVESLFRSLCPPVLFGPVKRLLGRGSVFEEGFASWDDAAARAGGYDSEAVLARVVAATRKVVAGEARGERDSVLLDHVETPWHLLTPMLGAAREDGGRLSVLDFGGSLGSTYRACRPMLGSAAVAWHIVEQPAFVAAGRTEFSSAELRFHAAAADIPPHEAPNVVLFSSSLQYMPDPVAALRSALSAPVRSLVLDRTPFLEGDRNIPCVQRVPPRIYPASYPMWILGYHALMKTLSGEWTLAAEFESPEGEARTTAGTSFVFRGLILKRKSLA